MVFVYGTLMDEKIRYEVLGRKINGIPTILDGYDGSQTITIEDEPYLAAEKNIECSIKGQTIELTSNEISKLDDYETGAYKREEEELPDGIKAWIYLNKNSK